VEGGEVECGETGELVQQYEDKGWVGRRNDRDCSGSFWVVGLLPKGGRERIILRCRSFRTHAACGCHANGFHVYSRQNENLGEREPTAGLGGDSKHTYLLRSALASEIGSRRGAGLRGSKLG